MSRAPLSAFLVDDEPMCRADFRITLQAFPEVHLLGEAGTLSAARKFLESRPVDLLFLDLSVGRENGLDLIGHLPRAPMVIAITAHPQHAARGFALDLVDYVLKPVEEPRLRTAVEKAHLRRNAAPLRPGRIAFVAEIDRKKTILELAEVLGAEAMGNYVLLHTTRGKAIKRATFQHVKNKLPENLYLQVNRGRLVARHTVREWSRNPGRHLVLHLADGESLHVSRNRSAGVFRQLREGQPA